MTHDPETIRRLVAEVISRLQQQPATASPAAAIPVGAGSISGPPRQAGGVAIAGAVVTLAAIERLPPGTKRAVIATRAVVTPSARDRAREAGIELVRAASAPAAVAARPFMVAHAECGGEAAGRCAAIARGVPGSQQLPTTGLADVVSAMAAHAARDGGRAVLLCGRPAVAVALANRSAGVRAVTARDAAGLVAAIAECAANIVAIDPRAFPSASLDRLCADFATRDLALPPKELAAPAASPCSCKGHTH